MKTIQNKHNVKLDGQIIIENNVYLSLTFTDQHIYDRDNFISVAKAQRSQTLRQIQFNHRWESTFDNLAVIEVYVSLTVSICLC